jgi:hypothetical protein
MDSYGRPKAILILEKLCRGFSLQGWFVLFRVQNVILWLRVITGDPCVGPKAVDVTEFSLNMSVNLVPPSPIMLTLHDS